MRKIYVVTDYYDYGEEGGNGKILCKAFSSKEQAKILEKELNAEEHYGHTIDIEEIELEE